MVIGNKHIDTRHPAGFMEAIVLLLTMTRGFDINRSLAEAYVIAYRLRDEWDARRDWAVIKEILGSLSTTLKIGVNFAPKCTPKEWEDAGRIPALLPDGCAWEEALSLLIDEVPRMTERVQEQLRQQNAAKHHEKWKAIRNNGSLEWT